MQLLILARPKIITNGTILKLEFLYSLACFECTLPHAIDCVLVFYCLGIGWTVF